MPKAKTKAPAPRPMEVDDDSDDEYEASQSMTQADRIFQNMTSDDIERKVSDTVQYLLIKDLTKLPVKRQEITKNVLKEHSKVFNKIMEKARERLEKYFGISVVELDGKPAKYILINTVENESEHIVWSEDEVGKMGLLTVILSTIFMKGNVISDTELYHMLKKLGVDIESHHELFGDVKKLITQEFTRQLYLDYEREPKSDPPSYTFKWGPRAFSEITKRHCLSLVCQMYDTTKPESWVSQWEDIKRTEGIPEIPSINKEGHAS